MQPTLACRGHQHLVWPHSRRYPPQQSYPPVATSGFTPQQTPQPQQGHDTPAAYGGGSMFAPAGGAYGSAGGAPGAYQFPDASKGDPTSVNPAPIKNDGHPSRDDGNAQCDGVRQCTDGAGPLDLMGADPSVQ